MLLRDEFTRSRSLITNEFAIWNPLMSGIATDATWEMQSGSVFQRNGIGWTGQPDGTYPNIDSSNGTHSSIFRLRTKRADFGNVAVDTDLRTNALSSTSATPAVSWDGVHMWLHYQSEYSMYYISFNRRDGVVMVKKKVPGGTMVNGSPSPSDENGGHYYPLTPEVKGAYPIPFGAWQHLRGTIVTNADGTVTIKGYIDGVLKVSVVDNGSIGGPPITAPGRTGLRGDNADLEFDNFTVSSFTGS